MLATHVGSKSGHQYSTDIKKNMLNKQLIIHTSSVIMLDDYLVISAP